MKLSVLQENLATALTHVSRFVTTKAQLPILGHVLLSTDSGRLKLSATNLEMGINYTIGAKIDTEGSLTLPAKDITEFVSYLSPGKIDLSLDDKRLLSVVSPRAKTLFATQPASDFPAISTPAEHQFEIDSDIFVNSLSEVIPAAATDDSRPLLTAVLCRFSSDEIELVATDGFRLSQKTIKLVNPISLPADFPVVYLPSKTLLEVTRLVKSNSKLTIGLSTNQNQVSFIFDQVELTTRILEGLYPDYKKIIPTEFATKITLSRDDLLQAIKVSSVFARQSANVVRFSLQKDHLTLSANAPQVGQNQVDVDCRLDGEPLDIAFNYKFVSDFLSFCHGSEIVIHLNQPLSPTLFSDSSDPHLVHIIMPVRLQD